MEVRLPVHSIIEAITNSSTEIFTSCYRNAHDRVYEMLNEFLKLAKVDGKAEDMFNVTLSYDFGRIIDRIIDNAYDNEGEPVDEDDVYQVIFNKAGLTVSSKERGATLEKYLDNLIKTDPELFDRLVSYVDEDEMPIDYIITSKVDNELKAVSVLNMVGNLTHAEEYSC